MRKTVLALVLILVCVFATTSAFALTVTAKSISSGTYEDGKFTPSKSGFEARYVIDEAGAQIKLVNIINNDREGKMQAGAIYDVSNISVSEGISALLVARNKKGQKIFTAVREGDIGATEVLIMGEDFYEYCRAANGKFYLEYGEVTQAGR